MIIRSEKHTEIQTQELLVLALLVQGETQKSTFKVRFSSICFAFTKGWSCNNFFTTFLKTLHSILLKK